MSIERVAGWVSTRSSVIHAWITQDRFFDGVSYNGIDDGRSGFCGEKKLSQNNMSSIRVESSSQASSGFEASMNCKLY
jgi:hypothetical protein